MKFRFLFSLIALVLFSSCGYVTKTGLASYYADYYEGRTTANGEIFRQSKKTAAHKTIPFGTKVVVTNLKNNKSVVVRINDRGPFVNGRIIDLTKNAAKRIGMLNDGVANVKIRYKKR
jgi:rare lipoprotein A